MVFFEIQQLAHSRKACLREAKIPTFGAAESFNYFFYFFPQSLILITEKYGYSCLYCFNK